MSSPGGVSGGGESRDISLEAMKDIARDTMQELSAERITSKEAFLQQIEQMANPFAAKQANKRKELEKRKQTVVQTETSEGEKEKLDVKHLQDSASKYAQKNPELKAATLVLLRQRIKSDDDAETILDKLLDMYPDVSLADDAMDYLLETASGKLKEELTAAKEQLTTRYGREIQAGRNIQEEAREAAFAGLGTPTSLRDMYRDITGNPRDSQILFQELSQKYEFKDLKPVIDFLLHSLGRDMKSKGPSIPRGELHRLLTETRSLQAILGVYRFFQSRMQLVHSLFQKNGLSVPKQLNFEEIARQFMALAAERYPSSGKVLERSVRLGIEDWILAKIIVFSQFRDAVREVAMKQIYRSLQHRDDLYLAILEALEDLEDRLEEEEEEEEEDTEAEEEKEENQ